MEWWGPFQVSLKHLWFSTATFPESHRTRRARLRRRDLLLHLASEFVVEVCGVMVKSYGSYHTLSRGTYHCKVTWFLKLWFLSSKYKITKYNAIVGLQYYDSGTIRLAIWGLRCWSSNESHDSIRSVWAVLIRDKPLENKRTKALEHHYFNLYHTIGYMSKRYRENICICNYMYIYIYIYVTSI